VPQRLVDDGPAIFVFLPHRQNELEGVRERCPQGHERVFMDGDQIQFTSYEVLEGSCQPFAHVTP
jgi:hypothetical protein